MGRACIENELNRKLHMRIILEIHDAQGRSNQININPTKKHTNSNQIKREHKTQIEQDRIKWNHSWPPPELNNKYGPVKFAMCRRVDVCWDDERVVDGELVELFCRRWYPLLLLCLRRWTIMHAWHLPSPMCPRRNFSWMHISLESIHRVYRITEMEPMQGHSAIKVPIRKPCVSAQASHQPDAWAAQA